MTRVQNNRFDPCDGLTRGRSTFFEGIWYLFKMLFFLSPFPWPSATKVFFLRLFGAKIGIGVKIKPRVNVHFPWKLEIGDYSWIGEEVFLLNLERICIGRHCCISQRAFLCTGNHDFGNTSMKYRNAPITIEDGAWVGAQVFVSPSVRIGLETVVTACSVVTKDLPNGLVCSGNPCRPIKARWMGSGMQSLKPADDTKKNIC